MYIFNIIINQYLCNQMCLVLRSQHLTQRTARRRDIRRKFEPATTIYNQAQARWEVQKGIIRAMRAGSDFKKQWAGGSTELRWQDICREDAVTQYNLSPSRSGDRYDISAFPSSFLSILIVSWSTISPSQSSSLEDLYRVTLAESYCFISLQCVY